VVDVCIRSIRRKVDDDHEAKLIHTIWGVGYCVRRPEGE
jgi:two-component system copper resistance phosphate regulon response regulator CusR